jgi:hypothetical protein
MGKERNRLRLERDKRVSKEALPELERLREEQLKEKNSSKAAVPKKTTAPKKITKRITKKKAE